MFRTFIGFALILVFTPSIRAQINSPALVGSYTTPGPYYQIGSATRATNFSILQANPNDAMMTDLKGYQDRVFTWVVPIVGVREAAPTELLNPPQPVSSESRLSRGALPVDRYGNTFGSLLNLDFQRQLGLTDAQRDELKKDNAWSEHQLLAIRVFRDTDAARADVLERDYLRKSKERINKLLTPEQLRVWRNVTGQRFEFPRPATAVR